MLWHWCNQEVVVFYILVVQHLVMVLVKSQQNKLTTNSLELIKRNCSINLVIKHLLNWDIHVLRIISQLIFSLLMMIILNLLQSHQYPTLQVDKYITTLITIKMWMEQNYIMHCIVISQDNMLMISSWPLEHHLELYYLIILLVVVRFQLEILNYPHLIQINQLQSYSNRKKRLLIQKHIYNMHSFIQIWQDKE